MRENSIKTGRKLGVQKYKKLDIKGIKKIEKNDIGLQWLG